MSLVSKSKYEKRVPLPKPPVATIDECAKASNHNLQTFGNSWRCLDCLSTVSRTSINARNWLRSRCYALPYDDSVSLIPIPGWHLVQIGNTLPHSSHTLYSHRGIVTCVSCGGFSSKKCRKLAQQCSGVISYTSKRALDRLRAGQLPETCISWPRAPRFGIQTVSSDLVAQASVENGSHEQLCYEPFFSGFDSFDEP